MPLILAGLSHKTSPIEVREALAAVGAAAARDRLQGLQWQESVVLSTCNRFEVYAVLADPGRATEPLRWMEDLGGRRLQGVHYQKSGLEVVRHLFSVAAGLDSLVVGEAEILGQVKEAYESSRREGLTGKRLNQLFQRALYVGKRVRSGTAISAGHISVASVAVELAQKIFGSLSESRVLILGAGKMAELSARHLLSANVKHLLVSNRTWSRGVALAERFQGQAVRWEEFTRFLSGVDIVICSTGSEKPILDRALLEPVLPQRRGRSLFLIDIALPRDVEGGLHELDHVYVYTLEDLRGIVEENISKRRSELEKARRIVEEEVLRFSSREGLQVAADIPVSRCMA